jgi:hypothetical protein
MGSSSADFATAHAHGLTQAHRLWFGQAPSSTPIYRADMVPAGFVAASAADMGAYLLAQLGHAPSVAPTDLLDVMHTGIAPTGIPDQRYGFGWFEGRSAGRASSATLEARPTWHRWRCSFRHRISASSS